MIATISKCNSLRLVSKFTVKAIKNFKKNCAFDASFYGSLLSTAITTACVLGLPSFSSEKLYVFNVLYKCEYKMTFDKTSMKQICYFFCKIGTFWTTKMQVFKTQLEYFRALNCCLAARKSALALLTLR